VLNTISGIQIPKFYNPATPALPRSSNEPLVTRQKQVAKEKQTTTVVPTSIAHADYLARTAAEKLASQPTTAERLTASATEFSTRSEPVNPADHRYTISTRSFAPPESFGGGFQGDNRGYSTDPDVTSRIHSTVTIDADDQVNIAQNDVAAHSDPSVHHVIPFYRPTETPEVRILSQAVEHNGDTSTLQFEIRHSGKDAVPRVPIIDVNPSPSLDVTTDLTVVSNREENTLTITGNITGDNFPAAEVFIHDQSGRGVFLATGKPPAVATPLVNLLDFGIWDRQIADVDTKIHTDDAGHFLSVEADGQSYSIDEWNALFESRDPGFTDPLEGINAASLEIREGYREIGDAAREGWNEIRATNNPLTATLETAEALEEIALEAGEAAVSTAAGLVTGTMEASVGIADAIVPGDGIPFVDLDLPAAPGWWPGK